MQKREITAPGFIAACIAVLDGSLSSPPPPLNPGLWLRSRLPAWRRRFLAAVILLAAFFVLAEGNLPRAETSRIEEPCGIALIGACLPRKVVAWERTQGAVVEATQGFTLLEMAIVLTVIGLIVGGILWGQEMIGQAATRAQISQMQKYFAAVNTFRTKYNALPGDMDPSSAAAFGFIVGAGCDGSRGNVITMALLMPIRRLTISSKAQTKQDFFGKT